MQEGHIGRDAAPGRVDDETQRRRRAGKGEQPVGAAVGSPLPAPPVGTPAAAVPSHGSVRTQRRIHTLMDDIFGD